MPLDAVAHAFLDGFLEETNPQFTYWLPRYTATLKSIRDAIAEDRPDAAFELIWKTSDNGISFAGQGTLKFETAEEQRNNLTEIIRDIAQDGEPGQFDQLVDRLEQLKHNELLPFVPRLLLARAFAGIHPDRYHTTVDATKQDRVIPWFVEHTDFLEPEGNWAAKATALTAHLAQLDRLAGNRERRNMFPWYVFDQLRDTGSPIAFKPGHTPRNEQPHKFEQDARTIAITYRHNFIQNKLFLELRNEFGKDRVRTEHPTGTGGLADVLVLRNDGRFDLYEIKPAGSAREAIRQAIGQLLEYSYWENGLDPARLIVVSDAPDDDIAQIYLQDLSRRLSLELVYLQVPLAED